jgi:SAM-dependent methyltransferase
MALNKLCELRDWRRPYLSAYPQHRKHWEYQHFMHGLRALDAIRPDAWVLSVAGGHEWPVYELTNVARWVFCTDLYDTSPFPESDGVMLRDPDRFAPCPYNRRRLVVECMDALDLRFEDATFDIVFSLSSIEHFGGIERSKRGLAEMCRVLKPGGVAAITTEVIVNGVDYFQSGNLQLFSPAVLREILESAPGLRPVEPVDFSMDRETRATMMPLAQAASDPGRLPHLVLSCEGREFTSLAVFLRKQVAA